MNKEDPTRHATQFPSGFSEKFWHVASDIVLGDNVVLSPYCVYALMAMMKHGSTGNTAKEIQDVFHFPKEKLAECCHELLKSLKNYTTVGVEVSFATALFAGHGGIRQEFQQTAETKFLAEAKLINFAKQEPQVSAKEINDWVELATKKKIKKIVGTDDISKDTVLVLVNAIYFKGQWLQKFNPAKTAMDTFYFSDGNSVEVSMMRSSWNCPFAILNNINAKAIGLPYAGNRFTMVIILPNDKDGLDNIKRNMDPKLFTTVRSDLKNGQLINIQLPKFTAQITLDLIPVLKTMGIRSLFQNASLGEIFEKPGAASVTKIVQKCFLEISEEGTEAVAATAVVLNKRSMPMALPFIVNHPFLYYIIDDHTGSVLFVGSQVKF